MSDRLEKIADEILSVVTKKRVSGETPEEDVWVATYLPNRKEIAVIFGDREVSNSYMQFRCKQGERDKLIAKLRELYGDEPKNHNEQSLDEDTVYDHSWYEVKGQKYPKRTKEGVIVKESYDEPIQVWNLELKKNPYISREEIYKAKEIFFKEICDHADEYPNFKELVKVLQSLLDKGIINDKQYKFCRTNWDDLFGEYDPDVYGDSDITESAIKEGVEKINPKVLDELYDIISDQMGDMYMANYDEIDFDNLLDSVEDFGNDIDGYNSELKKDYALALKAKWEENHPSKIEETCSAGATCSGSVSKVIKPMGKISKRKRKKVSEEIDSKLFLESILNDMPCESEINGHKFKYFMNEGKWYMSVDNSLVKTYDKNTMMETFVQVVDDEPVTTNLLEEYSCYEMDLLMEEEDDLAPTQSNPTTSSELTGNPSDTENTTSVSLDNTTVANAIGGEMLQKAEEQEKDEPPKTSQEIADEETHNQEILGSENKDGTIETEDGKTKDIKIGKTMDINGEKNAVTMYTDENGKEQMALTKDINLKQI